MPDFLAIIKLRSVTMQSSPVEYISKHRQSSTTMKISVPKYYEY